MLFAESKCISTLGGGIVLNCENELYQEAFMSECDTCGNLIYDDEIEDYVCDVDMDEDDLVRFLSDKHSKCPYYQNGDEYNIVRKQL